MTPDSLFTIVNGIALLSWLPLMVRPRHPLVQLWTSLVAPLVFGLIYVAIIAARIGGAGGDFTSLAGVAALFRDKWFLLAGWVHYLAFDLLIGVWLVRDAESRSLPHWRVVPCLVLTFLFGPAGWLLYLVVRTVPLPARHPANPPPN